MWSIGSPTFRRTFEAFATAMASSAQRARHAPGIRISEDFADRQARRARRARKGDVHDQFFPDHLLDVVEQGNLETGRFPNLGGGLQKLLRQPGECAGSGSSPSRYDGHAPAPVSKRRNPRRHRRQDDPRQVSAPRSPAIPGHSGWSGRSSRTQQRKTGTRRRLHIEGLGGNDDEIAGSDAVCRCRGMNRHRAIAACAFATQALGSHRLGMVGPKRDRVNLMAGIDHERGIDRSHCATADNRNFRHLTLRASGPTAAAGLPRARLK